MPQRQTGSVAINFRGGAQSEILARAFFAMIGTAVPVPREDDYGIDLLCTLLSEREGQLVWPIAPYSVQVKSDLEPWVFPSRRSVEFVVGYGTPLLLCVVSKAAGTISIYQTLARFGAAVAPELPETLSLRPEGRGKEFLGSYGYDDQAGEYLLGPPIVQLGVAELADPSVVEQVRAVLQAWLELDYRNVIKYQIGLRRVELVMQYRTNEVPVVGGSLDLAWASAHTRQTGEQTALEIVRWLVTPWANDDDYVGALLGLLLLRHKDPGSEIPLALLQALLNHASTCTAGAPDLGSLTARLDGAKDVIARSLAELNGDLAARLTELTRLADQPG